MKRPASARVWKVNLAAWLFICGSVVASPAVAGSPPDIQEIDRVLPIIASASEAGASHRPPSALRDQVVRICLDRVARLDFIAVGADAGLEAEVLRRRVERQVDERLKAALVVSSGPRRRANLMAVLRWATSDRTAHWFIAAWLDHKPVGAYSPGSDTEEHELEKPPPLSSHLTSVSQSPLRIVPDKSAVIQEEGGAGAGNKVVDAGEWVELDIAIHNIGRRSWYSSSAWIHARHPCAWTDRKREHVLAEMPPTQGMSTVRAWVYFSRACSDGEEVGFSIRVLDSRRARKTALELQMSIRPTNVGEPRPRAFLDADLPGTSDGSNARKLGPGGRIEASIDLEGVPAIVVKGGMWASLPTNASSLVKGTMRSSRTEREGLVLYGGDDIDLVATGRSEFERLRIESDSRWLEPRAGTLWIACEVRLAVASPLGRFSKPEPSEARTRRAARTPPTGEQVARLARESIVLVPRAAKPRAPGAVASADGVEAVFDDERFLKGYAKLLGPAPPAASAPTKRHPPVWYVTRYYLAIPLSDVVVKQPDPEPEPEPEPAPAVVVAEPRPKRTPATRTWDAVAGLTVAGYQTMGDELWASSSLTLVGPSVRLEFGYDHLRWFARAEYLLGADDGVARQGVVGGAPPEASAVPVDFSEFNLGGGVGYDLDLDPLHIQPHGFAGLQIRQLTRGSDETSVAGFRLELGVSSRIRLSKWVAINVLEFGFSASTASPTTGGVDAVGGTGWTGTAGVVVFLP